MSHEINYGQQGSAEFVDPIEELLASTQAVMAMPTMLDASRAEVPEQQTVYDRDEQDRLHHLWLESEFYPNPQNLPRKAIFQIMLAERERRRKAALATPDVPYEPSYAREAAKLADYRERGLI